MRERWSFRTLLAEQQKGRKWKKRFDNRGDAVAVCHDLRNLYPHNASIINIELAQDDL